jgi:hypothetical protein
MRGTAAGCIVDIATRVTALRLLASCARLSGATSIYRNTMKQHAFATLATLILSGAFTLAQAQTSTATTPSATDTAATPSTSTSGTMSSKTAAQTLEEAKKACKSEATKDAQQDCMKKAQADFKASKAQAKPDAQAEMPKK